MCCEVGKLLGCYASAFPHLDMILVLAPSVSFAFSQSSSHLIGRLKAFPAAKRKGGSDGRGAAKHIKYENSASTFFSYLQ